MANAVVLYANGTFEAARRSAVEKVREAVLGNNAFEARRLVNPQLYQHLPADFNVLCTTDSNDAASATNVALNLSVKGLTAALGALAANEQRDLFVSVMAANGANRYRFRTRQRVGLAAGELVLIGNTEFLTDCEATYGMTTADGAATTEVASECQGPAWFDGAAPVAGVIASNAFTINWLGVNSPVGTIIPRSGEYTDAAAIAGDARSLQHGAVSLANGTSAVFISDVATPTAATFANGSAVRVSAKVLPPISAQWFVNTATAPDELLLCPVGISGDLVTWDVSVLIGEPMYMPLL